MNYERFEEKPRSRKEVYEEISGPLLEAVENPSQGAEYLVALGEDMDRQSDTTPDMDKIRAIELLLRNLVNLNTHNPKLFSHKDLNPLVVELINSTEAMIGKESSEKDLGNRVTELQVDYLDANDFRDSEVLDDDYFQKLMAVQAFAFNAADHLKLNPYYYRDNIAAAVSSVYPVYKPRS